MKLLSLTLAISILTFGLGNGAADQTARDNQALNEYASMVFMLAGEHFASVKARGEKWILTTHDWADDEELRRYTDGEFTIVSIPNILPNFEGVCKFISLFNTFNLHEGDVKAAQGALQEARRWYELLAHFDNCSSLSTELANRLSLLDQIEKNKDKNALSELQELAKEVPLKSMLTGMRSVPPERVPDLLKLPVETVRKKSE